MTAPQTQKYNFTKLLVSILFLVFFISFSNELSASEFNLPDSIKDAKTTNTMDMQISPRTMNSMKSDPDNDFANMMIVHKKRAIDLSEKQISTGKDQETILLARKIIEEQNTEIEELRSFMKQQKVSKAAMTMSKTSSLSGRAEMDKMAFTTKTSEPVVMTGDQDKDYVSMLMAHHEKSIEKTNTFMDKSKADNVKKMALEMIASDRAQIEELKTWQSNHK